MAFAPTLGDAIPAIPEGSAMHGRALPRRQVVAALFVSLSLHALIGLCWLHARSMPSAHGTDISTRVDGPEDEVAFTLKEPSPRIAAADSKALNPETSNTEPVTLPPADPPRTTTPGPGAIVQTAYSPAADGSLEKSAGGTPLHGRPKSGSSIVYVIDRSSSMGVGGLLRAATAAVRASLAQLGPDTRFAIVAYNGGTSQLGGELLPPTPENVERAARWLADLTAEGRSDHRAGCRDALAFRPDAIYLLTDADDLDANETRAIRSLIRQPVTINAAIFGGRRTKWETPLEGLTQQSGGTVRYANR
jgi:von Willebrand factor type A domain